MYKFPKGISLLSEEFITAHVEIAKGMILSQDDIAPFALLQHKPGTAVYVPLPNRDALKIAISVIKPIAYVFTATGWMKKGKKEEQKDFLKNYKRGDLVKDPNRKEVLICSFVSKEKKIGIFTEIKRTEKGITFGKEKRVTNLEGYLMVDIPAEVRKDYIV